MDKMSWEANQERYSEMVCDVTDITELEEAEEEPNSKGKTFYHILESATSWLKRIPMKWMHYLPLIPMLK
ncbi:uncharacterized protein DS421_9g267200 [Arachis hypogaea]|nr:uncharacterized protein DS421_9g267200 [Arachis hypogaea]